MTIKHSGLETDLRLAAVLDQEIALKLADRSSIRNSGAVRSYGLINGRGSDTLTIRIAGLDGYDKFAVLLMRTLTCQRPLSLMPA